MEHREQENQRRLKRIEIALWMIIGSAILVIAVGATLLLPDVFKVEYNGTTRFSVDQQGTTTVNADSTGSDVALKILSGSGSRGDMRFSMRTSDPTNPQVGDLWYNSTDRRYKIYDGFKRLISFDDLTQQVLDATVNANHGTRGASSSVGSDDPAWTTEAKLGGCSLQFGGNDFVAVPKLLSLTNPFTVEAWIKRDNVAQEFNIYAESNISANEPWLRLMVGANGIAAFAHRNDDELVEWAVWGGAVAADVWTHVAATRSGNTVIVYVNGGATSGTQAISASTTLNTAAIGAYRRPTPGYSNGYIDEAAIWNRALSAAEITARYNGGAGAQLVGNENGLVAVWHMNDPN